MFLILSLSIHLDKLFLYLKYLTNYCYFYTCLYILSETISIDRDLNAAINILRRYEQNHIALVSKPLSIDDVIIKHNLFGIKN